MTKSHKTRRTPSIPGTNASDPEKPSPSKRASIDSFLVMEVMRAAASEQAQGKDILHLEVGQPGTRAPAKARQAVAQALEHETLGYTLALGITPLRKRISQHYLETYGIDIPQKRIVITNGSSAAFVLAFLATFDVGANVAIPEPGYPCYRQILKALGQIPVSLTTNEQTRWMPLKQQIEDNPHDLKGLLIASPANPTGTMITPDRLAQLSKQCAKKAMWFFSDEIYHGLTYGSETVTALKFNENAIVINSFSKYFSMTGWRVGWMVVPEFLITPIERLAQNLYISPPAVSQVAALGAFEAIDELEKNKTAYQKNRDLLLKELPKAGFSKIAPADGAFYLYCDISHLSNDSKAFAARMLKEIGIAATPGIDFDAKNRQKFIRFSYAGTSSDIIEATRRLKAWPRLSANELTQ